MSQLIPKVFFTSALSHIQLSVSHATYKGDTSRILSRAASHPATSSPRRGLAQRDYSSSLSLLTNLSELLPMSIGPPL